MMLLIILLCLAVDGFDGVQQQLAGGFVRDGVWKARVSKNFEGGIYRTI
jgi:hypothetical protein